MEPSKAVSKTLVLVLFLLALAVPGWCPIG